MDQGQRIAELVGLRSARIFWVEVSFLVLGSGSGYRLNKCICGQVDTFNRLSSVLGQCALIIQDDTPSGKKDQNDGRYHFMSLLLNLANTFLYMVNTYIIVPTADDYSLSLGAASTVCGVIIGSMAVAQEIYYMLLAYDVNSLAMLLIGRLLCGLGSARAVNRRHISDCVPLVIRMKASAGFVSASALGMAFGPALAGLLQIKFKIFDITFNQTTLPGWFMALAWLIYLLWLWFTFEEPCDIIEVNHLPQSICTDVKYKEMLYAYKIQRTGFMSRSRLKRDRDSFIRCRTREGIRQSLLQKSKLDHDEDEDRDCEDNKEASKASHKPANSISLAYKLLTPSVKVQLLIYFMLKYAMEIVLSESSLVTALYFSWPTSAVAIFLAILGLTVLPVNAFVGSYVTKIFEERQILLAAEIMVLMGIIVSFHVTTTYSVAQYVSSALITFVAAEVLEGVNLSLLSRVMSSRLARGTYNGGLLSTEAGTLARVVADGTITLAGPHGTNCAVDFVGSHPHNILAGPEPPAPSG
ncbi:hypothetical protein HPP92_014562 [Vanilla planifolia]|uniref:SPX domain-containing membrane protein n=1 Tax=Vanilla planifolia TaxID=51239 RepID=A0A835UU72_VANPL|nr:hypothetical protein HPP92_014562 [Vanilla planifolia]